ARIKKGKPTRTTSCSSASKPPEPEKTSRVAVMTAIAMAQKIRCPNGLKSSWPLAIVSVTRAAESTEVMKKMTTKMMAITEIKNVAGKCSRKENSAPGTSSSSTTLSTSPPSPLSSISKAACPKIPNHSTEKPAGTASTPETNCRMVRPLEMRAMKIPTNGDQLMVHAQ